jgi:hypothetical protein
VTSYNPNQILDLAPDPSSAKAAKGLIKSGKWPVLGADETSVWGECQGSGKNPYLTGIDLSGPSPAFKCSCPSRKFPCKHGLALFLILAQNPDWVTQNQRPAWLAEWISKRQEKAETKSQPKVETPQDQEKKAKQAQRTAKQRFEKMELGIREIETWLEDVMVQGLGQVQNQKRDYWHEIYVRMNDQQLPGLANLIQEIQALDHNSQWPHETFTRLCQVHILKNAFARQDKLDDNRRQDVLSALGVVIKQEDFLGNEEVERLSDIWQVIIKVNEQDDKMKTQRTWLQGLQSKRFAMILDYSYRGSPFKYNLEVGTSFQAQIVFYPGSFQHRAVLDELGPTEDRPITGLHPTWRQFLQFQAECLSKNPFLQQHPVSVQNCRPVMQDNELLLVDQNNEFLKVDDRFDYAWELLAFGGGQSVHLFGEWNGHRLLPLHAANTERSLTL